MRAALLFSVLLSFVSASSAFARNPMLLRKQEYSGFVPHALSKSLDCRILHDRVELTRTFAGVAVKTTRSIEIDGGSVYSLIEEAKKATLETTRGPSDGPTLIYEGFIILPTDALETITLSNLNGGDGSLTVNPSEQAGILKRILDELCQ